MEHLAQADSGPVIQVNLPTVNWDELIPQITAKFFDAIAKVLNDMLHGTFDGLWSSSANVVGRTDPNMTWAFGPVHDQVASVETAARAILIFGLVLLGLKSMLGAVSTRHADVISEFVGGALMAAIAVAAFPLLIPQLIELTNVAAGAVGKADISRYVQSSGANNPLIQVVLFIILLFFAFRLLLRCVWRVLFLAVMLPVGVLACALYAIPATRWVLMWWARMWGGMLLAQIRARW